MATPPNPPPPPPATSSSSTPPFKTDAENPNPDHAPALGAPALPAPPPQPAISIGPSYMVLSLRCVIGELRARGHVAGLEIPDGELTEAGAPALFVDVLAAFLAEVQVPCALPTLAMPPVFVADRPVDLLRLYLAVRSRGGFAAVSSWAAVAVALGLEPTAYSGIKVVYATYLSLLEQSIRKPRKQDGVVESSGNADHRSKAKKGKFMSPHKDHASAGSSQLKRKRNVLVEMLNWVRLVAKSPGSLMLIRSLDRVLAASSP